VTTSNDPSAAVGGARAGRPPAPWGDTALAVLAALVLCAPWAFLFEARVTDVSALRVARGEVPYRDFWTMYAPGSFLVLGLFFRALGEHLLLSNLLGVVTTVAAVAAVHRLVSRGSPRGAAFLSAISFALAFVESGFADGFTTYPPALLCVLLSFFRLAAFAERARPGDLVAGGLLLGLGACFKHDVAAYAAIACGLTVLLFGPGPRVRSLAALLVPAVIPIAAVFAWLWSAGAAPDLWQDLFVFPTTHFRHVRPESFPILPPLQSWPGWSFDAVVLAGRVLTAWAILHLPTLTLLAGLAGFASAWRSAGPGARRLVAVAALAFPLFWLAAHVQVNTHKVTLAALALVVAGFGLGRAPRLFGVICIVWSLVLLAEPAERLRRVARDGVERAGIPRLEGVLATSREAAWMRGLRDAMARAAPPGAPVLFAGRRNDVMIHADSAPFWLTDRRSASRHHELHPGVSDVEAVQRRMIAELDAFPDVVVVREHRFGDAALDRWRGIFQGHGVPVGSRLLDDWIASRYRDGQRYGRYEVLERIR
jgi:hypothetical protein